MTTDEGATAVDLELLDADGKPLACVPATLGYMDGACAILHAAASARLHWGGWVRFCLVDNAAAYSVEGVVAGHRPLCETGRDGGEGERQEVRIRLTDCRIQTQRRGAPRRRARFLVRYRALNGGGAGEPFPPCAEDWQEGWGLDVGAGGVRLKVDGPGEVSGRLALEFRLPPPRAGEEFTFQLVGRVIRSEAAARRGVREVAVKFERLPVEAGMRLSAFLCG